LQKRAAHQSRLFFYLGYDYTLAEQGFDEGIRVEFIYCILVFTGVIDATGQPMLMKN
jgi:hypothetical protein